MITVDERLEIPAPTSEVWRVISEPAIVVSCIDGASLGEAFDDGSFAVDLAVKFGPMRVKFSGRAKLTLEADELVGTLSATGADGQRATRAKANASFTVSESSAGTSSVQMDGEVELSGKLASLIESGASVVVRRMTDEFAQALTAACTPASENPTREPSESTNGSVCPKHGIVVRMRRAWRLLIGREGRSERRGK